MTIKREIESAIELVQRGSTWLDEHHPGWHELIDLDELSLSDSHSCVLGQLAEVAAKAAGVVLPTNGYTSVMDHHVQCLMDFFALEKKLTYAQARAMGFDIGDEVNNYALLDKVWTHEILKRAGK